MAITEKMGVMTQIDENGNEIILYPETKADLVDGLKEKIIEQLGGVGTGGGSADEATIDAKIAGHNTANNSHQDIRLMIKEHEEAVSALLNSDDETLNETKEIVAYIKSNKSLIDAITTSKVNVSDIINNLTTNVTNKPLSAAQGVALKALIDDIEDNVENFVATELAKRGQLKPEFVNSIDECTDTTKLYVLPDGYIYAYVKDLFIETFTDRIIGTTDNPWGAGRLSSGVPNGAAGYVTTPYIDLIRYSVPFELHLEGIQFVYNNDGNRRYSQYASDKTHMQTDMNQETSFQTYWKDAIFKDKGDGTCVISFTPPVTNKSGVTVGYARFSGQGTEANANVYITYEKEVIKQGWKNIGISFVYRNIDIANFTLSNPSVKAFVETADYKDDDYSYTNVDGYTGADYYRKDLPLPIIIGWEFNTNAVQYTVSINTLSAVLGTGMQTYYTKDNSISIYNLIPDTTYYYKVYGLCADGTTVLIKEGSITTTKDRTRMLNIDGIQNTRDIGGYMSGISGASKMVKYGLIYRGSAIDETISDNLHITDEGKKELLIRVGVKTDLDLRGKNNVSESVLGNSVDFYAPQYSYSNYAGAITDATSRGYFKDMLEYIVTQLAANKPVYIHCSGGCDRTGTLVFLLLGLLGVSESDLAKEYELSSFSAIGKGRKRDSATYDYRGMVAALKEYRGETIASKFYDFAITGCGISADTITNFRTIMLE